MYRPISTIQVVRLNARPTFRPKMTMATTPIRPMIVAGTVPRPARFVSRP